MRLACTIGISIVADHAMPGEIHIGNVPDVEWCKSDFQALLNGPTNITRE